MQNCDSSDINITSVWSHRPFHLELTRAMEKRSAPPSTTMLLCSSRVHIPRNLSAPKLLSTGFSSIASYLARRPSSTLLMQLNNSCRGDFAAKFELRLTDLCSSFSQFRHLRKRRRKLPNFASSSRPSLLTVSGKPNYVNY
jgi:hypothetical protein